MPEYITPVGVQQVSITIANGSASATATISAVGTRAFILYGGNSGSEAEANNSSVFTTLTNSTTVTATRSGTTGTCIITCSVVDATPDLVTSVQYGTVTLVVTNTSNTAVISAVNANTSALQMMGLSTADIVSVPTTQLPALTYAGTTVTATVTTAVTSTMVVSFCMIEFAPTALNSNVQIFSTAWLNSSTSTTQAITSIALKNTILIHGGHRSDNATTFRTSDQRLILSNATTVTIAVDIAGSDTNNICNFTVIEFMPGILNGAVQRGGISIPVLTKNEVITSVNLSRAACFSIGSFTSSVSSYTRLKVRVFLTDSTTVTGTRQSSQSDVHGSYQVLEFGSVGGSTLLMMGVG